jgi:hypothetical protein
MAFKPGQSGNPGGRPRGSGKLAQLIRDRTEDGTVLFERLLALATGEHHDVRARLRAIEILLDRGFGRTALGVELNAADEREPPTIIIRCEDLGDKPGAQ